MKVRNKTNSHAPGESQMQPAEANRLPVDSKTGQPLQPRAQPGYYPGFSTLAQQAFWDEATRKVILARIEPPPLLRFFSPEEAQLMKAVCDRLLPQGDRDEEHTIPLVHIIDERLASGRIDGYRFEGMPPDHEAHRLGLQAIDAIAQHLFQRPFVQLEPREQDRVLQSIHDCQPPAAEEIWKKMSVQRFWMLLLQDALEAYYAHPYAWDEIGFGGPAYPRGYMRLEGGKPEPWEAQEQRYEWQAPPHALSDVYTPIGGQGGHKQQTAGQEGTH
jgi:hypothetical protein